MEIKNIVPPASVSLFVKNIVVFHEAAEKPKTVLPFYADGYPGIMFQQTSGGLQVQPQQKTMPPFFLYGQTLHPIELVVTGSYRFIVFQLYPFVLKSFFGVSPKDLNDDCYDLVRLKHINVPSLIDRLNTTDLEENRISIITVFLEHIFEIKQDELDFKIRQSIQIIIDKKGQVTIAELCQDLKMSDRSFERRFINQVGISPKQLATIIRFDASLSQLNEKDYSRLTDIVYANGFADQSHFIRVFKAFTGTTPKKFGA